jgi:hypothetical protein
MTRYTITTRSGTTIIGTVQGSGGMLHGIGGLATLKLAADGKPRSLSRVAHEVPGHCIVYPEFSASENGVAVMVEIVGATVEMG